MEIKNMPASVVWGEYTTKSQFDTLLAGRLGSNDRYGPRLHCALPLEANPG